MALYMYQFSYTSESWAAQIKNPQSRVEQVGRATTEAAGGKFIGGWLCMGEYDAVMIADLPDIESMAAIALAVAAGGGIKSAKTTPLMTGEQGVTALKKVTTLAGTYRPAS
ncbi:MAG: GYD domain-containing protein [Rhodopseudomonas sp.]|uniref:GYD domain-containing protein n=1 Tax=Rhodopseudomonas sp. TaxID=1078 RepID=UPI0018159C8C|nr:GYD domain-containing protein [Rhodopseudomonas sp.]NVN88899.1 GYD domain-containing protein [Rhodopseudomonas sp.]